MTSPGPVRVVVADDQTVVREGLRSLLSYLPDLHVVAVADSGESALAKVEAFDPDVLLTDLRMPGMGGVAAIQTLTDRASRTRCVALTVVDDADTVRAALAAGALGFLTKNADPDAIAAAVHAAARGRSLLDPSALAALLTAPPATPAQESTPSRFTPREEGVLRLVAQGLSNQQVCRRLVVSMPTVKTHMNHLFAKTGCTGRADLVRYAYDHGYAH